MSSGVEGGTIESSASSPDDRQSFTSWKLDLLTAINLDPEVSGADMRFVVYIVQGLNQKTRSFNVSDETATEELNCKRDKLGDSRKRLEATGWLRIQRGRGFGDGSWYRFDESKVDHQLQERDDRRAVRKEARVKRRLSKAEQARLCAGKSRHSAESKAPRRSLRCAGKFPHNANAEDGSPDEPNAGKTPHSNEPCAERTPHSCAGESPHIHLPYTPISTALRLQDVAPEISDYATWGAEDWQALFDERAGVLEFDGGHSRADAERMAAEEVSGLRSSI